MTESKEKPTVECGRCGFRYVACHIDLTQTPEDGGANCECEMNGARIADLEDRVRELSGELTVRMVNDLTTQKDLAAARAMIEGLISGLKSIAAHGLTVECKHRYTDECQVYLRDIAADLVARHQQ